MNERKAGHAAKGRTELEPLRAASLADMVEKRVCLYIRENSLKPGDPLPKEFELAASLKVSRNIVREALGRLKLIGLVESRKRKGLSVADPDILSGFDRVLKAAALSEDTVRELFELRLVVEIGMSELIFAKRNDYYIGLLSEIVERELQKPKDRERRNECDIAFHSTLYKMAGNRLLERFQSILAPYFGRVTTRLPLQQHGDPGYKSHKDIVGILKDGTTEQFSSAMRSHLKQLREHFCLPSSGDSGTAPRA